MFGWIHTDSYDNDSYVLDPHRKTMEKDALVRIAPPMEHGCFEALFLAIEPGRRTRGRRQPKL